MNRHDPAYISLFSGAGGLDLGLEMAGWRTAYASDNDPFAVNTLKANAGLLIGKGRRAFDGTFIEQADVTQLTADAIFQKSGLSRGSVQLLAGGPPCQSWSSAGHQMGFKDPRGRLFDDFVRIANGLDTRWLVLENVRGLLTARGPDGQPGSALSHIRQSLLNAGFQTTVALLNAADFGAPQRRVRLFMVGFRTGDTPIFPEPTHAKQPVNGLLPWVSLGRALDTVGELSPEEVIFPTGKLALDLVSVPAGSGVKSMGKAERTRPGGHWGYKQGAFVADLAQSGRTVTASAQQDWVRDPLRGLRRLCPRECAAIQTFPHDWTFDGNNQAKYRQIGNAVPPALAKAIGGSLLSQLSYEETIADTAVSDLLPLSPKLMYHVNYTAREEKSNGLSRKQAPIRRKSGLIGSTVSDSAA
ncbi:DNA cytosine methyltransferase [Sphingomonas aurantiaca]|uniref:DNA cytosine methyltransferase n=1 Tax=Sphingomonas aurantiaca TaxID=185949 RepID=UPI003353D9F2